jgi:hypothetical protein
MVSKAEQAARRRAKIDEFRRKEQTAKRRRRAIVGAAVVVVVALVVVIVVVAIGGRGTPRASVGGQIVPARVSGTTTTQQATKRVPDTSDITGVLAWDTSGWPGDGTAHAGALEHDHVTGPVTYSILPPVGGPHNAIWMNAGVYTRPVPTERAVHNLEHGAVWITYDPDLPGATVEKLTAFVTKQSMISESEQNVANQANRYVDLSPWAKNDLPSKIVISSWGHQLRVDDPSDPRLQKFVDTFRHSQKYTPEFGAAVDGVPVRTGGRPATDGSRQPNPSGSAD